jgi:hypothetical protein
MGAVRKIGGASIRDLKARLQRMPESVAHTVAQQVAPMLTAMAQRAYVAGVNVYGDARPTGVDGQALDLYETGETQRTIQFVANGRIVRCVLGQEYMKYLIGKYKILPVGDRTSMPVAWERAINELVREAIRNPARVAA